MPKMTVRVILKSGVEFFIKCDKFTLTRNGFQQVTGYNIEGITENKPVYLDFEQVAAVVRVLADEKPETDDTPEEKRLFTETPMQCPFCEGENSNARETFDRYKKCTQTYCERPFSSHSFPARRKRMGRRRLVEPLRWVRRESMVPAKQAPCHALP